MRAYRVLKDDSKAENSPLGGLSVEAYDFLVGGKVEILIVTSTFAYSDQTAVRRVAKTDSSNTVAIGKHSHLVRPLFLFKSGCFTLVSIGANARRRGFLQCFHVKKGQLQRRQYVFFGNSPALIVLEQVSIK